MVACLRENPVISWETKTAYWILTAAEGSWSDCVGRELIALCVEVALVSKGRG